MNLLGVVDILESAGVAQTGDSLFINFMPTDRMGILLRDPFGGTKIDHELPGYRATSFMLVVRHSEYTTAETLMKDAVTALTMEGKVAGGMKINYMRPRTEPLVYQPSPANNVEMITNIDCSYVLL